MITLTSVLKGNVRSECSLIFIFSISPKRLQISRKKLFPRGSTLVLYSNCHLIRHLHCTTTPGVKSEVTQIVDQNVSQPPWENKTLAGDEVLWLLYYLKTSVHLLHYTSCLIIIMPIAATGGHKYLTTGMLLLNLPDQLHKTLDTSCHLLNVSMCDAEGYSRLLTSS